MRIVFRFTPSPPPPPSYCTTLNPGFQFVSFLFSGLQILYQMFKNIASQPPDVAQSFYKAYYLVLLEHLFSVASDPTHAGSTLTFCSIIKLDDIFNVRFMDLSEVLIFFC